MGAISLGMKGITETILSVFTGLVVASQMGIPRYGALIGAPLTFYVAYRTIRDVSVLLDRRETILNRGQEEEPTKSEFLNMQSYSVYGNFK